MSELGGKRILRIWAKHEPDPGHLREVIEEMKTLGAPTVRCVDWRGDLHAIEASHRLGAAFELGLTPNVVIVDQDRFIGDDETFWNRLKLIHYAWLAGRGGPPEQPNGPPLGHA
jgi:hypothetical protein